MNFNITADLALDEFIKRVKANGIKTILDVGCGEEQLHAIILRSHGFEVFTCNFYDNNDYQGMFTEIDFGDTQFDAVWCAHCLEHQENVGLFLRKIYSVLKADGLLAITVPPLKHKIVGGHLTLWNTGLLYYNLILAGFNCSGAIHKQYRYNISIITKKKEIHNFPQLKYDRGDIETLSKFFPFKATQNFEGNKLEDTF